MSHLFGFCTYPRIVTRLMLEVGSYSNVTSAPSFESLTFAAVSNNSVCVTVREGCEVRIEVSQISIHVWASVDFVSVFTKDVITCNVSALSKHHLSRSVSSVPWANSSHRGFRAPMKIRSAESLSFLPNALECLTECFVVDDVSFVCFCCELRYNPGHVCLFHFCCFGFCRRVRDLNLLLGSTRCAAVEVLPAGLGVLASSVPMIAPCLQLDSALLLSFTASACCAR